MAKKLLNERFQELAGIKPLETLKEDNIKEQMMNDPIMKEEVFTALAGLAGVLGMAGITTKIQMMLDDKDFEAKYPDAHSAISKIFGSLGTIANDLGKGGAGPKY